MPSSSRASRRNRNRWNGPRAAARIFLGRAELDIVRDEDRRLVVEQPFECAGKLHRVEHIAVERPDRLRSPRAPYRGSRRAASPTRRSTPSNTASASQASFCSAEALSVRTSTEPSTMVLSGSAGALPGQVKPSTVTRDAGAAQRVDDRRVGDLIAGRGRPVRHDRCGENQMHLTYPAPAAIAKRGEVLIKRAAVAAIGAANGADGVPICRRCLTNPLSKRMLSGQITRLAAAHEFPATISRRSRSSPARPGCKPDAVDVVVTVPTFRRPQQLLETLASLQAQETTRRFAVIVIENEAEKARGRHRGHAAVRERRDRRA